jgi:hypothetical protein
MSITIAYLVGTALASGLGASLVLFLIQKYVDLRLSKIPDRGQAIQIGDNKYATVY